LFFFWIFPGFDRLENNWMPGLPRKIQVFFIPEPKMRKTLIVASVILLSLGPLACNRQFSVPTNPNLSAASPTATPTSSNCGASNVTPPQAVNLLAGNLYGWYQTQSGNLFYSPFSILTAMSMAQEGAVGSTACQMQTALNLNSSASIRQPAFQQFISEINSPGKSYTLDTADDLWVQQGFNIQPSYVGTLQSDYDAGVTNVDFINNPSGALQTINGAVSQQTAGYIPSLLAPSNITPNTRLVLTNAVYFKASWQYQFPVSNTAPQTFTLTSGATESVSMMNLTFSANVGTFNGVASVLAIPYASNEASMYVFLPPQGGLAALESQMTGSNIQSWLAANAAATTGTLLNTQVALSLPKFTFSTSYDLTNTLAQMGMFLAFTAGQANFSGIDGKTDLSISDVVHQAYVSVNETGTTAAAATGVVICTMCGVVIGTPIIPFTVDHPFLFMIVDNTTNSVLFMGRVDDPLSNS
jgi:serpin B